MNATPHTHAVNLTDKKGQYYAGFGDSAWITYGDTKVKLAHWWQDVYAWSPEKKQRRVLKTARKAIGKHDRGSIAAGEAQRKEQDLVDAIGEITAKLVVTDLATQGLKREEYGNYLGAVAFGGGQSFIAYTRNQWGFELLNTTASEK